MYLCLLLYVTALYIRPGDLLGPGDAIPFVEILALITTVTAIVSYLRRPRPWVPVPHDGFVLGFWFAIVASNLASGWMGGALEGFVAFFKIVFYYFLMRFAVREAHQLRGLLVLLVGLNLVQAVYGILQLQTGRGLGGLELHWDGRIRSVGIFNDPNDLALSFVTVVPLLLTGIFSRGMSRGRRLLGLAALAPILVAVKYTGSRGALVGLVVIVLVFSLGRFGLLRGAPVTALALAVLLLTWNSTRTLRPDAADGSTPVATGAFQGPAIELDPENESSLNRIEAWSEGLTMFTSSPLFGVGYSRFTDDHEIVAHNSFIHTFAELGLLGAFFAVGLVYWYFKGLRARSDDVPGRLRARALTLSGVGFFTMVSLLSRQYDVTLYTLLGLGACHAAIVQGATGHRLTTTRKDLRNILLLTVGGIVATKLAVRVLTMWSRS